MRMRTVPDNAVYVIVDPEELRNVREHWREAIFFDTNDPKTVFALVQGKWICFVIEGAKIE